MATDPYNPLDMKALLCFSTMAKHASLTRASIELGISDSAVSQRIRALEKHLGTKLYEARGGRVRLTEAGHRTNELASRLFDQISELEDEVLDQEYKGKIVLGASAPIIRYQLPEIVSSFRRMFPRAIMRLPSQSTTETIRKVRRNDIDVGIVPRPPDLPQELVFHPWRTFRAFVLIPHNHPLARNGVPSLDKVLTKDTLSQYPQVVPDIDKTEKQRLRDGLKKLGLPFNVSLEVGDLNNVKHYCKTGHGLAVVNGVCLSDKDKQTFHLIEVPKEFDADITYGVVLFKGKYLSKPLRTLLDLFEVPSLVP